MARSIKLKNDNYLDSSSIVHNQVILKEILKDSFLTFEETNNGWCLKLDSGFMIQVKALRLAKSANDFSQDGNLYYTNCDMGNWDVSFKTFLYAYYAIGKVEGSRLPLMSGNAHNLYPTEASCGTCRVALNWKGGVTATFLCIGFGFWK